LGLTRSQSCKLSLLPSFLLGEAALVALSWPAVAVAQPASTAIISIGDGHMIRVRLTIGLNINLAVVEAGLAGSRRLTLPRSFRPEMLDGRPQDIEPRWQAMISGADGGDQICC